MAAALGPLACPSRRPWPRKARGPNLTLNIYTNLLAKKGAGGGSKNRSLGQTQHFSYCFLSFFGVTLKKNKKGGEKINM